MDGEPDDDLLRQLAAGNTIDYTRWPALLESILSRLDKIALNHFPIPKLPPPRQPVNPLVETKQPSPASPGSRRPLQETDKENNQLSSAPPPTSSSKPDSGARPPDAGPPATTPAPTSAATDALPPQIQDMLKEINKVLRRYFSKHPPHTIQRLAELILEPRRHYRHLAPYLHAVDRVVHVTSGSNIYPLPPAIPDMSSIGVLSNGDTNPAAAVAWGNPTSTAPAAVGSDEALGGALLTPIPWLTRRSSPHGESASSSPASTPSAGPQPQQAQHEIRTESTETIEGPNGMGSIETVSVSTNRTPSASSTAAGPENPALRPITQGELLRQEQQRGVVPVNQLTRQADEVASHHAQAAAAAIAAQRRSSASAGRGSDDSRGGGAHAARGQHASSSSSPGGDQMGQLANEEGAEDEDADEDEDETPHARGPGTIGVNDLGPQSERTMRHVEGTTGGPTVDMQGIDVEAAVGRKPLIVRTPAPAGSTGQADDGRKEGQAQESSAGDKGNEEEDVVSDAESEVSQKREAEEEPLGSPAAKKAKDERADADRDEIMKETEGGASDETGERN